MGWFGSSEERDESKLVDTNGQVNNNVIIQEARDVHDSRRSNEQMVMLMYFMCGLEIVKCAMYIYCKFVRKMKKKYTTRT